MNTSSFLLPGLPGELSWHNSPADWKAEAAGGLTIIAGAETDWFTDPAGGFDKDNAPCALFTPEEGPFILSAKVAVDFSATYDAGVLQVRAGDGFWGKLCFEYSPQVQPMIVSVVTRGVSDDCNSVPIEGSEVYLRLAYHAPTFAFHFSRDGRFWHLVRYFGLGGQKGLRVGFSAQAPTGSRCKAVFTEIAYKRAVLRDLRNGE